MIFNIKISFKKWVKLALFTLTFLIGIISSFNYIINPYGNQNIFCNIKYKPVLNVRSNKYNYIFYQNNIDKYDSIILGSSRVMQIIPSHFTSTEHFYNFGLTVANIAENLSLIEEWLKRSELKKIYLGIDYYSFHKKQMPIFVNKDKFINSNSLNYFSLRTLKLSYKSLINQITDNPITFFNKDGSIKYFDNDLKIQNNMYDFSKKQFQNQAYNYVQHSMINNKFVIEKRVFDLLKRIKKISIDNDIELKIFITPVQYEALDEIQKHPTIIKQFAYIDSQLINIFGKVYKFNNDNKHNRIRNNFYDIHHYRSIIGDKIIKKMTAGDEYGTILYKKDNY